MNRWPGNRWAAVMLLLGLVLVATGRSLGNGFAFDDVPIVLENSQVHQLAAPWVYAQQSYWPPDNLGDAYRPWTVGWFAIQWAVGGGSPFWFHLGNVVLTAATTLLVFTLSLELLTPAGALVAAALFAVHPVHVEATANVVGQAELWMVGFSVAAAILYVRGRRRGALATKERLALAGLVVLASASKEQGIVLPGLLAVLELVVVPRFRSQPIALQVREVAGTFILLGVVTIGFGALRFAVLGDLGGGPPAAGLERFGAGQRTLVMAPLVIEWTRLLLWPAHLLAQYSPPAHGAAAWTVKTIAGFAVMGAVTIAIATQRRRAPNVVLGLGWILVSLLLVSNIPFPTGVLVAERTLLLPSVGLVVLAGAGFAWWAPRIGPIAPVAAALLVGLGAARSWSRLPVWHDNLTLFRQTVIDEPRSYRAHFVLGRELVRRNEPAAAIAAFATAGRLYQGDRRVFEEWGQLERAAGHCDKAIPIFEQGVVAEPSAPLSRSRLFECLFALGRVEEARQVAAAGTALGLTEFESALRRATTALSRPTAPPPSSR